MVSAMSDLFQSLADAPAEFVAMVADVLERRAADPEHQAIVEAYVGALSLPDQAAVLEIGCGTGAICRYFAGLDSVARVRGIDPAPGLIASARDLALDLPGLEFRIGRGEATGESAESYDIVVLHTVLSHVADPAALLAEALQQTESRGVSAGTASRYQHSVWAYDLKHAMPESCSSSTWLPYMSGYGGIGVVMLPTGMIYYYASDNNEYGFMKSVAELNKISPLCGE